MFAIVNHSVTVAQPWVEVPSGLRSDRSAPLGGSQALEEACARAQLKLWTIEPDRIGGRIEELASCLDADERRRAGAIRSEWRRRLFTAAHVGLRHILAGCLEIDASAVAYRASGPAGKPELDPMLSSSLRFNMSHTRGLALVAVAHGSEVGIDVEWTGREWPGRRTDPGERRELLVEWTRREAVAKLSGEGLAGIFAHGERRPGRGRGGRRLALTSKRWPYPAHGSFALLDLTPTPAHVAAVALADLPRR